MFMRLKSWMITFNMCEIHRRLGRSSIGVKEDTMKRGVFALVLIKIAALLLVACFLLTRSLFASADTPFNFISDPASQLGELTATDIFIGKGVTGPYLLTWKGIVPGSEKVMRDSTQLEPSSDYRINEATGEIFFNTPLETNEIARVDYLYTPGQSTVNASSKPNPITFNLLSKLEGNLVLNAVLLPSDIRGAGSAGTSPNPLDFSLSAKSQLSPGSSLQSAFYLDTRGGNLLQRSGLSLDQSNKTSIGSFNLHFARGGANFSPNFPTSIAPGAQTLEGIANFNPLFGIKAAASFTQTNQLTDTGVGNKQTTLHETLTGSYRTGTQFSLMNTQTYVDPADSSKLSSMENNLHFSQRLGTASNLDFVLDCISQRQGGTSSQSNDSTLSFASQPSKNLKLSGSWLNSFNTPNGTNDTKLNLVADPSTQMNVIVSTEDRIQGANSFHNRQAQVNYNPSKNVSLTGGVQDQTNSGAEDLTENLGASIAPSRTLQLSGNLLLGNVNSNSQAQVKFTPLQNFTLTGGVQDQSSSGVRDLSANMGVSAAPSRYFQVSGGVQVRNSNWGFVNSSSQPDSYNLQIALQLPWNEFRLTGGIQTNPCAPNGTFTLQSKQNLGIQSAIGPLNITGNYAYSQNNLQTGWLRQMEVRLGWRLAPNTSLSSGYSLNQTFSGGITTINNYSLNFTRSLGSTFNLSLGGGMTDTIQPGDSPLDRTYQANAQLAYKF